jgi:HSP20 family molecular chaperone IbpA
MTLIRFDPFRDPLERLLSMAATGTRAPLGMPMDVYRAGDGSYHVEAGLPGADPDSVEVTVEHSTLTIRAERTPHYGDSEQVIVAERPQGSFTRQLSLGEGRGPGEPHRRLCRRCPSSDHPRLAQDPGPPGRDHPCARRQPHDLGEHS